MTNHRKKSQPTTTLCLFGNALEFNLLKISHKQFDTLRAGEIQESKAWVSLQQKLENETDLWGFEEVVAMTINNREVSDFSELMRTGYQIQIEPISKPVKSKSSKEHFWLASEIYFKHYRAKLKIDEKFDPYKLQFVVERSSLFDGATRSIISPYYQDQPFILEGGPEFANDTFLISSNGVRYSLS